jgi:hypothetical protein
MISKSCTDKERQNMDVNVWYRISVMLHTSRRNQSKEGYTEICTRDERRCTVVEDRGMKTGWDYKGHESRDLPAS